MAKFVLLKLERKIMSKQYLFVANWKMHLTFNQTVEFATTHYDDFVRLAKESNDKILLCPSFESLYPTTKMFKSTPVFIGAQNCSSHTNGSFTGQVAPESLHELDCTHCIVGHSETRREECDNNELIAHKCIHLLDYDITPILCIGETEEEYKAGKTLEVLEEQLKDIFEILCKKASIHSYLTPHLAYEPVWAVGTGNTASNEHLDMVFTWLQEHIAKNCSAIEWKLLYGGSITPQNIAVLKRITAIDGFLIGKSSLDFQKLKKIVQLDVTE